MKYIKTFEEFIGENNIDEISNRFKPRKESRAKLPFFFQIYSRDKDKDGTRETHRVSVTDKDDYSEIKRQVEQDYPRSKWFYTIWQNVRGGFKNIGTNESEDFTNESISKKYRKGDRVQYKMDIPASNMLSASKAEKSKNIKTDTITNVTKKFGQNVYVLKSGIEISDSEIIGLDD